MGSDDDQEDPSDGLPEELLAFRQWEEQLAEDRDARISGLIGHLTRQDTGPFGDVPVGVPVPPPLRPRVARRGLPLTPTTALVVACLLLVVAVAVAVAARSHPDGGTEIAHELEDLARRAELGSPGPPGDGGLVLHYQEGDVDPDGSVEEAEVAARFLGDGQVEVSRTGATRRTGDRGEKLAEGTVVVPAIEVFQLPPEVVATLVDDPGELLAQVAEGGVATSDDQAMVLSGLVASPLAPPGVRAAAIRALAGVGAEPLGELADRGGRRGPAVAVGGDDPLVVVFGPDGRSVLEQRRVPQPGADPAAATWWRTFRDPELASAATSPP